MYALLALGVVVLVIALGGSYDPMFYVTYAYFGLGIAASLAGSVMGIIAKPQAAKGIIIAAGAMIAVYVISYVLADGSDYVQYENVTEGMARFSGTLIYMFYILTFGAVAAVIFSAVNKLIR